MKPRAFVIVIAVLYIVVGLGELASHLPNRWQRDDILIEATELVAVICGVFLLFGKN